VDDDDENLCGVMSHVCDEKISGKSKKESISGLKDNFHQEES
jgi:hypothetical protein